MDIELVHWPPVSTNSMFMRPGQASVLAFRVSPNAHALAQRPPAENGIGPIGTAALDDFAHALQRRTNHNVPTLLRMPALPSPVQARRAYAALASATPDD